MRITHGAAESVTASVRGSREYTAGIEWQDGELALECSCEYFESSGPCKHLWATVLAAQAHGDLTGVGEIRRGAHRADEGIEWDRGFQLEPPPLNRPDRPRAPKTPSWKIQIAGVTGTAHWDASGEWPSKREILYVVEVQETITKGDVVLSVHTRDRKQNGGYAKPVAIRLPRSRVASLPVAEDRRILTSLTGASQHYSYGYSDADAPIPASFVVRQPLADNLIPEVARTGRCYLRTGGALGELSRLDWDEAGPWRFELEMRAEDGKRKPAWLAVGVLRRERETMETSLPVAVTPGFVFARGMVAPLAGDTPYEWLSHLRRIRAIQAPSEDRDELLAALLSAPGVPRVEVPPELRFEEIALTPRPRLQVRSSERGYSNAWLTAELFFDYGGRVVPSHDASRGVYDAATRRFLLRDAAAEEAAGALLSENGFHPQPGSRYRPPSWYLAPSRLPRAARTLVDAGWHIDADGKVFRTPGAFRIEVASGIDWFELRAGVEYGETSAGLPELLDALRRGDGMVALGDGSYGMLPEEWLRRMGMLAGMGTREEGHIRFRKSQAGLLDALLAAQPEAKFDANFAAVRKDLLQFRGVKAAPQPKGFQGRLRGYQREGLGWMRFLERFGFGGCLADDMGVGKTAQVLALLESRRTEDVAKPSLVVVPRSLVFNWKEEAARFTPRLRVLDYTGQQRSTAGFSSSDLILTTYGTLRRDAALLRDFEFGYVVLDEAQAVKNASSESAKAVRLLRGEHRLALSGTPVENHLGELWSLFDFLNPGMLGAVNVFKLAGGTGRSIGRSVDEDGRGLLAHALRPFILRRTKEQVARELPAKTEQTLYCELEPAQRKLYNELRRHYRSALLERIDKQGLAKSKIMVLEALLRLRQAACHPGLIDAKRSGEPSAKLEALMEQLREVLDAGHKALVFSQFTSLLKIVRDSLDGEGVVYEYLDGATRDRQARVERFQNDPACPLFLISLKAGGLGLNLTAAGYVFLLDPWWNPAVEAQAVDRAHRIGQDKPVFAYRLIARDTVEEKVLELQKTKRDLAAAIIGEDNALIRDLRREDLELLLS